MTGRFPASTTAWRSSDVWAEDHRHARPCLSGTDADIGLTDRPSPDARRRAPPVAARPRRPCTIPFTVPPTRANVDGPPSARGHHQGGTQPMPPHETGSTATPGGPRATAPPPRTFGPQGPTLGDLSDAYLQDYQVRQFRSTAPPAAAPPISPRSSAAPRGPPRSPRTRSASTNSPGAPPGRPPAPSTGRPRPSTAWARSPSTGAGSTTVPGFPDRLRENPPPPGLLRAPRIPCRPRPPARPVAGHPRPRLLLRLAETGDPRPHLGRDR